MVDLDAQRLEGASGGVPAGPSRRSGNRGLHDLYQLERGLDRRLGAGLDDATRDAGRKALVAVYAKDSGEVCFVVGVHDLCCG